MKVRNSLMLLFLCVLVFALLSCENNRENKQEKNEAVKSSNLEETLKEINKQIETAIYNNDYETLLKFYTEDAVVVPNFQPVIKGKNAIRESYLKQQKEGVKIHSFHADVDKMWECGNEINEYGTFGLSFSTNKTSHPYGLTGSYFMIWERQNNNSLLIKYFISNLDFNPCNNYYN